MSSTTEIAPAYPTSRKLFPNFCTRYLQYVLSSSMAHEFGNEAVALLAMVALQEHRMQFSSAPAFWASQFGEVIKLPAARATTLIADLVKTGWLHRQPADRGQPGRYWVGVPGGDTALAEYGTGD